MDLKHYARPNVYNIVQCMQVHKRLFNWMDGTIAFRKHMKTLCHKEAVEKLLTLPSTTKDIGQLLSRAQAQEKAANRHCLLKVISASL